MPGCSALKCTNSTKKGFLMKRFPRDRKRRKEWTIEVNRKGWIPTDHCYLCEVHFECDMWERTREDGSRKLKANAVPTIFYFSKPKQPEDPLKDIIELPGPPIGAPTISIVDPVPLVEYIDVKPLIPINNLHPEEVLVVDQKH